MTPANRGGTYVASRRFRWDKLPIEIQVGLARACGLDESTPADALRRFGEPPKDTIIRDYWTPGRSHVGLRDGWLADDDVSRREIVRQLRARKIGYWEQRTRSPNGELGYLRSCTNTKTLRDIVMNYIIESGRDGSEAAYGSDDLAGRYRPLWTVDSEKAPAKSVTPYPHQKEAWRILDRHKRPLAGIVVLPTGAGKTRMATQWILKNVLSDPNPRTVLWIAHRAELLQQAAESFIENAASAKRKQPIRVRVISSAHRSPVTTLVRHAEIVLATVQSLSRRSDLVEAFFKDNPRAFVVIDEAHHAAAKSYRSIIESMRKNGRKCDLLGLTATPTRTDEDELGVLFGVFRDGVVHQTTRRELIESEILSRPIIETVRTNEDFEADFTKKEWSFVRQFDELSQQSLQRIASSTSRNKLIVNRYQGHATRYGKTLVFAANIAHCQTLARAFQKARINADYVASRRHDGRDQTEILDQYRNGDLDVLVSVGMLTEGFDAPSTKTVFLARPTGSQILLKQMIGRGMRGEAAGGYKTVRLVSFRDHWRKFPHLWEPEEIFDGEATIADKPETDYEPRTTMPIPWDLYERLADTAVDHVEPPPNGPAVGWYDLRIGDSAGIIHTAVLVWEHQRPGFEAMLASQNDLNMRRLIEYFDDTPDPLPSDADLKAFGQFIRDVGVPPFFEFTDRPSYAPRDVAEELKDTSFGDLSDAIRNIYESSSAAQAEYGSFHDYSTAVHEAANRRFSTGGGFDEFLPQILDPRKKLRLGRHDLDRLLAETVDEYDELLSAIPDGHRLRPLPPIRWGRYRAQSYWAFYRSGGRTSGRGIVVNPILQTTAVKGETLRFLLYHELLHHVLGTEHGHQDPFRKWERRFDGYQQADAALDSLADRYKVTYDSRRSKRKNT